MKEGCFIKMLIIGLVLNGACLPAMRADGPHADNSKAPDAAPAAQQDSKATIAAEEQLSPEMAEKKRIAEETIEGMKEARAKGKKPTRENIEENVKKAVSLLEKEGQSAFQKFAGKDSEFIQANACYIYAIDMQGKMVLHPVLWKMHGQNVLSLRDKKGKPIIAPIIGIVKTKGEGWYSYWWPKPDSTEVSEKVVFAKKAVLPDGTVLGVASGEYDI